MKLEIRKIENARLTACNGGGFVADACPDS